MPEERIHIRSEDPIAITQTGARILSDWVPRDMAAIEKLMAEQGLLQRYPVITFETPKEARRRRWHRPAGRQQLVVD